MNPVRMAYTAEEVVQLFKCDASALDSYCMEGSDDELEMEEVEVMENPFKFHAPEFESFEELHGNNNLHIQ